MRMHFKIALAVLPVFLAISTAGQSLEKDKAEASSLARAFSAEWQQTQDISPLMSKYFTRNFVEYLNQSRGSNLFDVVDVKTGRRLTRSQMREYFVASANWWYLATIYHCLHRPPVKEDEDPPDIICPEGVKPLMRNSKLLSAFLHDETDEDFILKSVDEVLSATKSFRSVNVVYRKELAKVKAMSLDSLLKISNDCNLFDAKPVTLNVQECYEKTGCAGIPHRSRIIWSTIPGFVAIEMSRINGRMKIIRVHQHPGD